MGLSPHSPTLSPPPSRKTLPCHAGSATTVSAQPLGTPPGQFLGLEPWVIHRKIPPCRLSEKPLGFNSSTSLKLFNLPLNSSASLNLVPLRLLTRCHPLIPELGHSQRERGPCPWSRGCAPRATLPEGLKREPLQGRCQRQEKPAQHFPQPDVVSPGHKIKRLRRNMKRRIDFSFWFFSFSLLPAPAGPPSPAQEVPVWAAGVMVLGPFPLPWLRSQTSPPLFEIPSFGTTFWGHSSPRAPNVAVPCGAPGCWRKVTAPIPLLGCLENAPVPSPAPARSLPDDPRAKLSRAAPCERLGTVCGSLVTELPRVPPAGFVPQTRRIWGRGFFGMSLGVALRVPRIPALLPASLGVSGTSRPASPWGWRALGAAPAFPPCSGPGSELSRCLRPRLRRLRAPAGPGNTRSFSASLLGGVGRSVPWLRAQTGPLQPGYLYPRPAPPLLQGFGAEARRFMGRAVYTAADGAEPLGTGSLEGETPPPPRSGSFLVQIPDFQWWHSWRVRSERWGEAGLVQGRDPCSPGARSLLIPRFSCLSCGAWGLLSAE